MSRFSRFFREEIGAEKGDDLTLSQLEGQRKEAGDIVYRWFRFRARRGLGLFYALLAFLPVLGNILAALFASQNVAFAGVTVGVVCIWVASRVAGSQGFGMMRSTIDLLKEDSPAMASRNLRKSATFLVVLVWPWIAFAASVVLGQRSLEALFAVLWLVEFVVFRLLTQRSNRNPIVSLRVEDWVVVICLPLGALVSVILVTPSLPHLFGFTLVSPLLLFSGIKSLFDAPKELVTGLGPEPE